MLPTVTRASEEILRTIPDTLREGALALGAPQWRRHRAGRAPDRAAGLVTAMILGVARAVGETAPMLLTAFGSDSDEHEPVLRAAVGPSAVRLEADPPAERRRRSQRAWTGALVLVLLVLVLFVTARFVAEPEPEEAGESPMTSIDRRHASTAPKPAGLLRQRRRAGDARRDQRSARGSARTRCSSGARSTWPRAG